MSQNKKNLMLWGGVLVVGLGLIIYANFSREVINPNLPAGISKFRSPLGLKAPASCQVGGEIDFIEKTIFSSQKARIKWQNVDSQGRLILWKIEPEEDLNVGPNLFSNLEVPDGESSLTMRLPESPSGREYRLTASVTYGVLNDNDNVVVVEAPCVGEVRVKLSY